MSNNNEQQAAVKVLARIRNEAAQPRTIEAHGRQFSDGMRRAANLLEEAIIKANSAAPVAAAPVEHDVPFSTVQRVVRALTQCGVATPYSQEEQASRAVELIHWLCDEVPKLFIATSAAPGIDHNNLVSSLQSMRDRMMAMLVPKFGDAFDGDFDTLLEVINVLKRIEASPKGDVHSDDLAVDSFAAALKAKLAEARAKGRGGWNGDEPGMQERLSGMLRDHVERGDPRDVANFCMFLHQRGEGISPNGVVFENYGDSEARFIADGERLNCPTCCGSGHVDDAIKFGSAVVTDAMVNAALRVQYARAGSVWTGTEVNPDFVDMRHILTAALQATSADGGNDAPAERCESGSESCGQVEHWDIEGVPLCAKCWDELQATSAEVGECTLSGKCDCIGGCKHGRGGNGAGVSE